jgi:D-alanyl-lipoteichoic acid acyltransferase DltB (MBOAT superfamily)
LLFTSLSWLVFLLAFFAIYHGLPVALRRWGMLVASVVFYSTWSVPHLALIAGQLLVDWTCGFLLGKTDDPPRRKAIVAMSVVINLGVLCVFKYYGLFGETLRAFGIPAPIAQLTLPLAISFYTFESMSYTIDVYRRQLAPVKSPLHLALFITWFPHLIAGPIIRPSEFVPQLERPSAVTRERFFSGLNLMAIGYTKKLFGADWLATLADPAFAAPERYTSLELVVAVYAYAFQIYLDFSAYTDIARGASRWFGIELPENFDSPYLATSITDFWRRWHLTLSHWLRDYLYVSLGGNRLGNARTYVNLMATMLLGGLWHGASWTFLVWGGLHGLWLAVERGLGVKATTEAAGVGLWVRRVWTFHLVCLAWVLFRAPTFSGALAVLRGIARVDLHVARENGLAVVGAMAIIAGYWALSRLRSRVVAFRPDGGVRAGVYLAAGAALMVGLTLLGASTNAFIYFQF